MEGHSRECAVSPSQPSMASLSSRVSCSDLNTHACAHTRALTQRHACVFPFWKMGLEKKSFGAGKRNKVRAKRAKKVKLNQKTELLDNFRIT